MLRTAKFVLTTLALASLLYVDLVCAAPIPPGDAEQTVRFGNVELKVLTYRPNCKPNALLLSFHGVLRQPETYRRTVHPLADRLCLLVLAPGFDEPTFPGWRYSFGGIVHNKIVQDRRTWTGGLILQLVAWARREEHQSLDYYLIGHSAGAQFLSRVAAFVPTDAKRIIIANPSTHVWPSLDVAAPYGMGGVYSGAQAEAELRRYLAQPVTIYLGEADTDDKDEFLAHSKEAMAQGRNRFERGLHVFEAGKKLAASRGWKFSWQLVRVPSVGHDAGRLYVASQMFEAMGPSAHSMDAAEPLSIPAGVREQQIWLGLLRLKIFTYRPSNCREPSLLLAFHGNDYDALVARDNAQPLADQNCLIVVAPALDRKEYPQWRYHHGGLIRNRVAQDARTWSGRVALELAAWVRQAERRQLPYALIGHSAGGDFLNRFAAFVPSQATRIVVANAGSYVMPSLEIAAPRGFGGLYAGKDGDSAIQRYLAQPLTIFLGEDDDAESSSDSAETIAQGRTPFQRGLNAFAAGKQLAARRGWSFNWRLVRVPHVGHSSKLMYASSQAREAVTP